MVRPTSGASAPYSKLPTFAVFPQLATAADLEQEQEAASKPTAILPTQDGSDNLSAGCTVCHCSKPVKDALTCGRLSCDQQLEEWQGLGSSRPASVSSSNRCPVCNDFKSRFNTVCAKEFCIQRLKFWQGLPGPQSVHTGSSSYSSATQTRSQTLAGSICQVGFSSCCLHSPNVKTFPCGSTCTELNPSGRVEMCDRAQVVLNIRVYPNCTCGDEAEAAETNNGTGTGTCTTCLICWRAPANIYRDEFCSDACRGTIERKAPLLLEVPRGHPSFDAVEREFRSAWTNPMAACPTVKKVYMVCLPAKREANFEDYGKNISSTYAIPNSFLLSRRKEELRWISGLRDCLLGHPGITTPCQLPQCQLCNILRGTQVPEIFGKGIATTSLLKATHHYDLWAGNSDLISKILRVVLLSKVYLGKVAELDSIQAVSGLPHGANSVNIVNFVNYSRVETDEILVYTCEALRPVYLISYQ